MVPILSLTKNCLYTLRDYASRDFIDSIERDPMVMDPSFAVYSFNIIPDSKLHGGLLPRLQHESACMMYRPWIMPGEFP